ncbi:MAG: hypothetical protein ACE5H7_07145 [Acidiferrobacterales bacterium]
MIPQSSSVGAARLGLVKSHWFRFLRKCIYSHRVVLCALPVLFTLPSYAGSLFYIPSNERHVEFNVDVFRDTEPTVIRAYTARYNQEYLLFQGQGAQAELIYSAMNSVGEPFFHEADALEFFPFEFFKRNETWKINWNQPKDWDVETTYRSQVEDPLYGTQTFTYAPYRLVNSKRHCFNFETKWDEPGYDPDFSPRQVLFGYYCMPPGRALSKERIQGLIRSLHVRSDPVSLGMASLPMRSPNDRDPALVARGTTADTGNEEFPILFHIIEGQIGQGDDNGGMN